MIRFFRRIRQQLINENNTGNYLKYAIGEIVLVVIGILIALQINNWNQNRKNSVAQIEMLSNLKEEFSKNQETLNNEISNHLFVATQTRALSELIGPEAKGVKPSVFNAMILGMCYLPQYYPSDGVINSIMASEQLSLIKNNELKYLITTWPGRYQAYSFNIKINYDYYMNHIYRFLSKNYPLKNMEVYSVFTDIGDVGPSRFSVDQETMISNPEFENHVEMRRLNADVLLTSAKSLYEFQEQLLAIIEIELSNPTK